jgi:putative two-component system response regulator
VALVLIADDRSEDRKLLRIVLEGMGHTVIEAEDGEQAYAAARERHPDIILSDILMPRMDGFALCRALQKDPEQRLVPFVFVTATYGERQSQEFATEIGAARVLTKPFEAAQLRELMADLSARAEGMEATQPFDLLGDTAFHQRHAEVVGHKLEEKVVELELANVRLLENDARTRELMMAMVETIITMVEWRDPYTVGHQRRVGDLAAAIAAEMGFDPGRVDGIRIGGYLHDVGKIAVPSDLLAKPVRLKDAEMALVRIHAESGHDILSKVDFPWPLAEIAYQHHERLDGAGYPRGLAADAIIPEARIVAVADVMEAMTSHRPYRAGLGMERALAELENGRGTIYDPEAVDACTRLFREHRYAFS